jgi:hypothetical protein
MVVVHDFTGAKDGYDLHQEELMSVWTEFRNTKRSDCPGKSWECIPLSYLLG